jgi:hypothetical protein
MRAPIQDGDPMKTLRKLINMTLRMTWVLAYTAIIRVFRVLRWVEAICMGVSRDH